MFLFFALWHSIKHYVLFSYDGSCDSSYYAYNTKYTNMRNRKSFFAQKLVSWSNSQFLPIACQAFSESYWSGDPLPAPYEPSDFVLHRGSEVAPFG